MSADGKTVVNVAGMFPYKETGFASVGPLIDPSM